jgi:lipoprotein NlpI
MLKGDFAHAIADYSDAIRLDPEDPQSYFNRALAYLYAGSLPQSLADLDQSSKLDPKNAYVALWREIVASRSHLASQLATAGSQIDMGKWPAPIIRLYRGEILTAAVLAAADDQDAQTKKDHICEANFFIGELMLQRGSEDEATGLFRTTAADCSAWARVANPELKALGVQR